MSLFLFSVPVEAFLIYFFTLGEAKELGFLDLLFLELLILNLLLLFQLKP